MNTALIEGLYGNPPAAMVTVPPSTVQLSPLVVGAAALEDQPPGSLRAMTMLAPAGTLERRYVLAHALHALSPDAALTVLALKDKGGRRIATELKAFGCTVTEASRSHYRIVTTCRPVALRGIDTTLADAGPQQHPAHGLWTQPGIFSWDRIDAGSALLLKHLPALSGRGADLGCGLGVLSAAALAFASVTSIALVDMDRRAVEMAQRNITDPRATFLWADARDALPLSALDFIIMNPPFHEAGVEDKTLGQAFVARAAALLKPGGTCWLTANRHLPYEALLTQCFTRYQLIAQEDGFKIYAAEK